MAMGRNNAGRPLAAVQEFLLRPLPNRLTQEDRHAVSSFDVCRPSRLVRSGGAGRPVGRLWSRGQGDRRRVHLRCAGCKPSTATGRSGKSLGRQATLSRRRHLVVAVGRTRGARATTGTAFFLAALVRIIAIVRANRGRERYSLIALLPSVPFAAATLCRASDRALELAAPPR